MYLTAWFAAIQVTGSEYVPRGSAIQLVCNVTGQPEEPPAGVDWYKDGRLLLSDAQSGLVITRKTDASVLVSVLAVRHSKMTDAGEYSCRASDYDVASIVVHVFNGQFPHAPRRPINLIAFGGTVQWLTINEVHRDPARFISICDRRQTAEPSLLGNSA